MPLHCAAEIRHSQAGTARKIRFGILILPLLQDWLLSNCPGNGTPDIDTSVNGLNNSNYQALITIEPKNRPASLTNTPFFIKLFSGAIGLPGGYGSINTLPNVTANYLPTATVQLRQKSGQ